MKRIVAEGRINEWCKDNIDYLEKEFGEKNAVRLCADDIMTKTKMEGYQDTYAEEWLSMVYKEVLEDRKPDT